MRALWGRISLIGVKEEMSFETKRRIILLNRISVTLFFFVITLRTVVIALGFQELSIQSLLPFVAMLAILLIPYFNKLGYYRINAFIFSIIAPIGFLFFSTISQLSNDVVNINHYFVPRLFIMGSIVFPLILIDYKDRVLMYTAILANIICILSFDFVVNNIGVPFDAEKVNFNGYESISRIMILPTILMVLGFLFLKSLNRKYEFQIIGLNTDLKNKNDELEQYNEEVITQRDMIHSKNELLEEANSKIGTINNMLTDSIMYAEKIQRAVLPKEQLPQGYFNDSFIFFKPKAHVSGDFFYYKDSLIDGKRCLIVAAVDCTGHGVPGGFLSMLGMTLINEILQNKTITNAADILNHLRDRIKNTLNQTGKLIEQRDGMEMALCIYYPETKELEYAGARIPLCLISTSGEIKILKGDRQPIAIYAKEKEFTNHHLELKAGEMLYIFSDGIQDQFGGDTGKKVLFSNLQKLLLKISSDSCEGQKLAIESFLQNWMHPIDKEEYEQLDDMVLVGMRV